MGGGWSCIRHLASFSIVKIKKISKKYQKEFQKQQWVRTRPGEYIPIQTTRFHACSTLIMLGASSFAKPISLQQSGAGRSVCCYFMQLELLLHHISEHEQAQNQKLEQCASPLCFTLLGPRHLLEWLLGNAEWHTVLIQRSMVPRSGHLEAKIQTR